MADFPSKVVMVVCGDRAIQESLRRVVEAAGCQPVLAVSIEAASKRLTEPPRPVLVLVDPLLEAQGRAALVGRELVPVPVRTSSTGVRRIAKRNQAAVRWLSGLVAERSTAVATG